MKRNVELKIKSKINAKSLNAKGPSHALKVEPFCKYDNLKVHPELKSYFAYCLTKAAARLRAQMDEALRPYHMISPQLGLLRLIDTQGLVCQGELAEAIGIDKATMVKFIDSLEQSGYLIREGSAEDRRIKYLKLTSSGKKMLLKGIKLRSEVERKFLSPLTAAERAILEKAMPKLV